MKTNVMVNLTVEILSMENLPERIWDLTATYEIRRIGLIRNQGRKTWDLTVH
jgi:hypothetical protein